MVGGLITGVSPCVLPVLPAIFLSGGVGGRSGPVIHRAEGAPPTAAMTPPVDRRRPYLVVAGLALSFAVFTLLGTLVLKALHIPTGIIRWAGLSVLVLLGLGMIIPSVEELLERPFRRFPQRAVNSNRGGFVLGLALGAVYVPCAGPVLAAITVAGATGHIGWRTAVLTLAFAVGTSIPLLFFALAGRGVAERVSTFRRHQKRFRVTAGVVLIGLAVGLTFNLTDVLQRAVPDYTQGVSSAIERNGSLTKALGAKQNSSLANCYETSAKSLQNCGQAPAIGGINAWFNTPGDASLSLAALKGKVVLIDFWAYSCINCQRAIPHVEAWYQRYRDLGFEVIGVHTPEYAFEHAAANVRAGAKRLGISYPVALDNGYTTWDAYRNQSWPADYLIDSTGVVRFASIGEGEYGKAEGYIRQLLAAKPGVALPKATDTPDTTPTEPQTAETYLGAERANSYAGSAAAAGKATYHFPAKVPADEFGLSGVWTVGSDGITAGTGARIRLNFQAKQVYLDVGGTGTVTATVNGKSSTYQISGAPNIYPVVRSATSQQATLDVALSAGLQAYSFTFG